MVFQNMETQQERPFKSVGCTYFYLILVCVYGYADVYIYLYACMHICICTCICTYTSSHVYTYTFRCAKPQIDICAYLRTYTETGIHLCYLQFTYLHTYMRAHIHTYIHFHIHNFLKTVTSL